MTEKRFIIIGDSNIEFIMQTQLLLPIYDGKKRLSLKECCDLLNELHEENQIKLEIVDAFILGMEDEKGIAPEDKEFQCKMEHTISVLKRLKEEMLNPTEFKRLKEENKYLEPLEGNVK